MLIRPIRSVTPSVLFTKAACTIASPVLGSETGNVISQPDSGLSSGQACKAEATDAATACTAWLVGQLTVLLQGSFC